MQLLLSCLCGGAAVLLESSFAHSIAYDRPIHTLVLCFVVCALLLNVSSKFCLRYLHIEGSENRTYTDVPLEDLGDTTFSSTKDGKLSGKYDSSLRKDVSLLALGTACLTLRLLFHQRILNAPQCTKRSYEVFLPLLLGLYDVIYQKQAQVDIDDRLDISVYEGLQASIRAWLVRPKWRYIPPTLLLVGGCYITTGLWTSQTSTYICPTVSGHIVSIPRLQQYSLLLDCMLAIIADKLSSRKDASQRARLSVPTSYGAVLIGSASCWIGYAIILFILRPENGRWLFLLDTPSTTSMMCSLLWQIMLFSIFFIATTYSVTTYGVFHVSILLTTLLTAIPALTYVWSTRHPFPPTSSTASFWAFLFIYLGLWSYWRIRQAVETSMSTRSSSWMMVPLLALFVLLSPGVIKNNVVHFHPIQLLMYDSKAQHDRYLHYASYSTTLETAVAVYKGRYQSNPPPHFDVWWEFAQNRSVTIVDDFDQIYLDLLPFRAIPPADLRRQTWELVSNSWNEVSGLSIRNGKAELQANVIPTHRWMLEGVAIFINNFAEHLPDMDIAFNLNDESRVAVPYNDLAHLKKIASDTKLDGTALWSVDRSADWLPTAEEEYSETYLENWSFQNTFARFGTIGCAPGTKARSTRSAVPQPYLCMQCAAPHSFAQFLSDWPLAADPCHQPDLINLHGFYSSPAAFKTSHHLLPIFSQSKAHGYNDIIYPSAWNYMDKVRYDPVNATGVFGTDDYSPGHPDLPFTEKENTLYWRGATSEGVSPGNNVWRGMTRQRLVHMANNLTTSHHDHVTILLPNPGAEDKYTYQTLSADSFVGLGLQTDIKMVDHIARCGGIDCTDQEREFGLAAPVDFQNHWKYRYLFDMDGAGFSGRFLPFLQSHSLPFKTAIFREWYDSRLTAWRHFVPQDIRLHGVWSTLAYFAGVDGHINGSPVRWAGHSDEAELIAEEGRKWAGQVLRKEDMEVYFFRLLLEWARLTDDRRDELGFVLE